MVADHYGVHHVEFQHTDFTSTEPEYLEEFRNWLQKAKCQISQINLEFRDVNLSSPDLQLRIEAVDLTKRWVDHAASLGSRRIMPNPGSLHPEVRPAAIDALKAIDRYAKSKGVFIALKNKDDGGPAQSPRPPWQVVAEVIKGAGVWANPDVGNFPATKGSTRSKPNPTTVPIPTLRSKLSWMSCSKTFEQAEAYSGLDGPVALSCLASFTRAVSSLC